MPHEPLSPGNPAPFEVPPEKSRATLALVLALVSYVSCGVLLSIPSVVLARQELEAIRKGRRPAVNQGRARTAFWAGSVNAVLYPLLGVFALVVGLPMMRGHQRDLALADVTGVGQAIIRERIDTHMLSPACVTQLQNLAAASAPASCGALPACKENASGPCWGGPYWEKVKDDPWGHPYRVAIDPLTGTLTVSSNGSDGVPGNEDDVVSITEGAVPAPGTSSDNGHASSTASADVSAWWMLVEPGMGFQIAFPRAPVMDEDQSHTGSVKGLVRTWTDHERSGAVYMVQAGRFDVRSEADRQDMMKEVVNFGRSLLDDGWTLVSERAVSIEKPGDSRVHGSGRELAMTKPGVGTMRVQIQLQDVRLISVTLINGSDAQWAKFTGSFKVIAPGAEPPDAAHPAAPTAGAGWTVVNAPEWGIRVSFPQRPTSARKDEDSGTDERFAKMWLSELGGALYSVTAAHYRVDSPEHRQALADDEHNLRQGYPEDGWTLVSEREVPIANPADPRTRYSCKEVMMKADDSETFRWRVCLIGARLFQISRRGAETATADADWAAFTGSFALTEMQPSSARPAGP